MHKPALLAALLLLALAPSTQARSFTGSVDVTSVAAPQSPTDYVSVNAQVTWTQACDAAMPGDCADYALTIFSVPAGTECDKQALRQLRWTVVKVPPAGGSYTPAWLEYATAGARTACLYANTSLKDYVYIAQADYTVPSPPPAAPAPPTPIPDPVTIKAYVCSDFTYREDAQPYLLPGDPYGLDPDGNGIACDELPSRPVPPAPVPAPAPPPALKPAEATSVARDALKARFKSAWTRASKRKVACRKRRSSSVRACTASWVRGRYRYGATVVVAQRGDGFSYKVKLRSKKRR